jgi:acyl carrier protein
VTRDEVIAGINKAVAEIFGIALEDINPSANLSEAGVDSLDMVEVFMEVENLFDIKVSDDEATELVCLNDLYTLICKKLNIE